MAEFTSASYTGSPAATAAADSPAVVEPVGSVAQSADAATAGKAEESSSSSTASAAAAGMTAKALGSLGALIPSSESASVVLYTAWEKSRPWSEFANSSQMAMPAGADVKDRVLENSKYYMYNYILIVVIITALNLFYHPLSFLGVLVIGASMYFALNNPEPFKIGPVELDQRAKSAALAVVSLLVLWVTGAGAAFVSLLFMVALLAGVHMALRKAPTEVDFETAYDPASGV